MGFARWAFHNDGSLWGEGAAWKTMVVPPRRPKQWSKADVSNELDAAYRHIVEWLLLLDFERGRTRHSGSHRVAVVPERERKIRPIRQSLTTASSRCSSMSRTTLPMHQGLSRTPAIDRSPQRCTCITTPCRLTSSQSHGTDLPLQLTTGHLHLVNRRILGENVSRQESE